jgi:hypothetical protein
VPGNPALTVYSPCEGHKWVPPAGRLLRSERSSPVLMMLYNEWLHQITCLRDGLIAFDNFEDVVLNLTDAERPGTRPMQDVREALLAQIARGRVSRETLLETAKVLTAPDLPAGGYGFQYDHGVVLPAALFSGAGSSLFLRYSPTRLAEEPSQQPVLFVASPVPRGLEKVDLGSLGAASPSVGPWDTSLRAEKATPGDSTEHEAVLRMIGTTNDEPGFKVDLGRVIANLDAAADASPAEEHEIAAGTSTRIYASSDVLLAGSDVVTSSSPGPAVIRASREVDVLAVLGKLDPEQGIRLAGRWKRGLGHTSGTNERSAAGFVIVD